MNSYFYVDTDDEITSVIGKLRSEKAEEIFLVVPKRALIAQSLVNLRLLDKEAKRHKKKLIFVSPDAHIRKLAEKAGLAVKKYIAKPKDESKEEALTLAPKSRKMEPWEEEAAKQELASIIKKEDPHKPGQPGSNMGVGGPIQEEISAPGTKIAVGAFSKPENVIARRKSKRAAEVIDLKKAQLRRKAIPFSRRQLKPSLPETQTEPVTAPIRRKPIVSKKESLPQEDVEKRTPDSKIDIQQNIASPKPEKSLEVGPNPFKVRKLEVNHQPKYQKHEMEPAPAAVEYHKEDIENPPALETPEIAREAEFQKNEREMANLTLKEKERLRDLWMEQKGLVRGRFVHDKASLDLSPTGKTEISEDQFVSQSSGFFKTTHRKVGGPGKIVDLRTVSQVSPKPDSTGMRTTLPNENFAKVEKDEKKVVLLPLINIRIFSIFVLIILVVLVILAGIIIPDAHVSIKAKNSESNIAMNATVSGEVSQADFGEKLIPGKPVRFKVVEEKTFSTTGNKEIKENAQGQVTVYNSNGAALSLKQNALLTDSSGKKFYTQAPILIPAGSAGSNNNTNSTGTSNKPGEATVNIQAEGISADYKLKEGATLTIPGLADSDFASGVTVEVKKEVTGGESRTVKTVTQEDLDKAKQELLDKAKGDSLGELEKNLDPDAKGFVKPESLTMEDITFVSGKAVGEETDSFNANATVTFFTLSFSQKDLEELGKAGIESGSSEKKGTVKVNNYNVTDAKPLENKMDINADLSYQITSQVDATEIRKQLVAKKKSEAEEYLRSNQDIAQFTLDIWPGWPARLPILERRIKVEIQD